MKRLVLVLLVCVGLLCCPVVGECASSPDNFIVQAGALFRPVAPSDPDRPAWLFATARGEARSIDGTRDWVLYELVLDRDVPFHHLLIELLMTAEPDAFYVRLLDGERQTVSADYFGNVAERMEGPGNTFLDISLADKPTVAVVQLLIPSDQEDRLSTLSVAPASYEILMRTAGDFISGSRAWIRTPVFDSRNVRLLEDLVLLEDGRSGDLTSPITSFKAYGVDARELDEFDPLPTPEPGYHQAGTAFALDALPSLARFDVTLRYFDPLNSIEVWVNNKQLGTLSLALPDLEDPAYWSVEAPGCWFVARWTRAWFYLPPEALRLGDNTVWLRQAVGEDSSLALEIRKPSLQFKYPWDQLATYSLIVVPGSARGKPIVDGVSPAPPATVGQEEDTFIVRTDFPFRPIGVNSVKPDWLHTVDYEFEGPEATEYRYRIGLNPENLPHQLGLDIIYARGRNESVLVSLLDGDRMVVEDLLGEVRLVGPYAQMAQQLLIPFHKYPEADTVLLTIQSTPGRHPRVTRLQLKAGWSSAVLASGHYETEDSLVNMQYDTRSAFIPAEVIVPDAKDTGEPVHNVPSQTEGDWYGAETRVLQEEALSHGDARRRYFTDIDVELEEQPLLARVDFLVMHLNVVDGMEVFVNGEKAGFVSLQLPGVHDANYMIFQVNKIDDSGLSLTQEQRYAIDYGPFARASLVFDGKLLRPGANTISIGRTPRLKGTNDHYTFKQVRLQMKYAEKDAAEPQRGSGEPWSPEAPPSAGKPPPPIPE